MAVTEVTIRQKEVIIEYQIQTTTQGKYSSQKCNGAKEQEPRGMRY
jgi:hypothetical protein